jgi:hypothetical protein
VSLRDLYERYHQQVQFLVIYLREAHPVDGWWLGGGMMGGVLELAGSKAASDIYDPQTMEERRAVAGRCQAELDYGIRTYVDDMDDAASEAYAALPTRLYLVGVDGRVVYAGGPGPRGFKPAELGSAIEKYLAGDGEAAG